MTFTTTSKREAVQRELNWRRRVYPNRVYTGRMTQFEANRQIAIFEEILAEYQTRERAENPALL